MWVYIPRAALQLLAPEFGTGAAKSLPTPLKRREDRGVQLKEHDPLWFWDLQQVGSQHVTEPELQ